MKNTCFGLLIFCTLTTLLSARLGETLQECQERYGELTKVSFFPIPKYPSDPTHFVAQHAYIPNSRAVPKNSNEPRTWPHSEIFHTKYFPNCKHCEFMWGKIIARDYWVHNKEFPSKQRIYQNNYYVSKRSFQGLKLRFDFYQNKCISMIIYGMQDQLTEDFYEALLVKNSKIKLENKKSHKWANYHFNKVNTIDRKTPSNRIRSDYLLISNPKTYSYEYSISYYLYTRSECFEAKGAQHYNPKFTRLTGDEAASMQSHLTNKVRNKYLRPASTLINLEVNYNEYNKPYDRVMFIIDMEADKARIESIIKNIPPKPHPPSKPNTSVDIKKF